MNLPGFTAEAALSNGNGHYQVATEAVYGGTVQPAFTILGPPVSTPVGPPAFLACQKWLCIDRPYGWDCRKVWGTWNPAAGRCE